MKMKTKIIAVFLALLCATPILSKPIRLRTKGTIQRGCLRMPSITQVRADYEGDDITVNIQGYTGGAYIYIYDVNGNVVGTTLTDIDVDGTFTIDVANLKEGIYTISVVLTNATYEGNFEVLE